MCLFGNVDDVAVFEFVGYADAFAFVARLVLVGRRGVAVDFVAFFGYDFHVVLAGILDHREVFLREHFGHVVAADQGNHQRYGKHHCNVKQVADNAHRVGVLA